MNAMHLGLITKALVPIFLNGYIMVLNGLTENTLDYGKVMAWNDHPDAFEWMTSQKQFIPGEGLMVLETQERILNFLIQCCQQLLQDIPELISEFLPVLPEPYLKPESETAGFKSLGVLASEGPYRVPAQLDLQLVESLLSARASAAEDHLWALREDPSYFARVLDEVKDHRQEMLKDLDGREHPVFRRGRESTFWSRVIGCVVSDAYLELELFSELSIQAKRLVLLQKEHADEISTEKELPESYLDALLRFRHYLNQGAKGPLNNLKFRAAASPPLRKFFAREPPPDPYTTKIMTTTKPGFSMNKIEGQLMWLFRTLWEDGRELSFITMPVVMDELERLLQTETQARGLLSSHISAIIGDISIISQCLNQLSLYQPWARSMDSQFFDREDQFKKEFATRTKPWGQMLSALSETGTSGKTVNLGEPSGGKFNYPIGKRRTKENVEALRRAESHLDAFWQAVDRVVFAKAGDLQDTAVRNLLSQPRILQRTREWVEPEKPSPAAPTQKKAGDVDLYAYQPISAIYSGLSAKELDVAQPKTKVKTRGTPRPAPTPEAEALVQPNPADPQPTFSVDARAFKVFRTVFFNPALTSTPGEVPWNDFLHAMASVGFTVMKLYGSVWQFQPTRLDVERNIQFHEPHPRGKLPFTTARQYGRRLNRAYGWFGGMFVLDEK